VKSSSRRRPPQQPRNDGMEENSYSLGAHLEECNQAKTESMPRADEAMDMGAYG